MGSDHGGVTQRLRRKTVAVGSGKGGVGKSTTAVNLAIVAAKKGRRVALIDLDPLSNIATILDISDRGLAKVADRVASGSGSIDAFTLPLFPRVDLLFPHPKLDRKESTRLRSRLFVESAAELASHYDIIICDMPAGIGHEENLGFLPYMGHLLVVTNPEPTSHVSAGGYIRVALEIQPDLHILLWHNRYREVFPGRFSPLDVVGNYNRYVDDELKISEEASQSIATIARIPDDPSLNLLRQSFAVETQVLGKLLDTIGMLRRVIVSELAMPEDVDQAIREELRYFINGYTGDLEPSALRNDLVMYFGEGADTDAVGRFLESYTEHPIVPVLHRALRDLDVAIESIADRSRMFRPSGNEGRAVKRARICVEELIGAVIAAKPTVFVRNLGGMLVCYLSLLMIMDSASVRKMIARAVPGRTVDGRRVRDRRLLIRNLVVRNDEYHRRYFELVKTLFPVLIKQVDRLIALRGWRDMALRGPDGKVNRNAYLKLLTHTMHDILHAGLGVFVGFRYNTAGRAIEDGAKRLLTLVASDESKPVSGE